VGKQVPNKKIDRANKNALAHGVFATDIVLPWENGEEFVALHNALRDELDPQGVSESETVLGLAGLHWKKRRLNIGSALSYRRHPDAGALTEAGKQGWTGVEEYVRSTAGDGGGVNEALRAVVKAHTDTLMTALTVMNQKIAEKDTAPPPSRGLGVDRSAVYTKQIEALAQLAKELNVSAGAILPALKLIETQDIPQSVAERAFRPDIIEREVKLGALIDKQIEKTLAHLVLLKEYKRLYGKKEVKGKPPAQIPAPL
jgi:hypothetical protein